MATTGKEDQTIHFAITYVKNEELPEILKTDWMFRKTPRRLYARLSIDDHSLLLELEASVIYPMKFLSKPPFTLKVELFAKRTSHADDLPVAVAEVQLNPHSSDAELSVYLVPSADSGLTENPILIFNITASDHFADNTDFALTRASLEVNSKLIKTFGYVSRLIKIGRAISEINSIAKALMALVELASSEFEGFISRNESLLRLVDAMESINTFLTDWDNPELDKFRPNQRRVCEVLLSEIYQSLYLLRTLSEADIRNRLSKSSVEAVNARREQLAALVERMKSSQLQDIEATIANMSDRIKDLNNDNTILRLRVAQDVGPSTSKACLEGTRVSLLSRINDWALNPTSERVLLLHGAAGKGKSSIAHSIAKALQSDDLVVAPFFAFNRSILDRSASQLIPTWAKQLAQLNPRYLEYLQQLPSHQLESSDILDQQNKLLIGGLDSGINIGKPIIFIIDALDECPAEEAQALFRMLRGLLSRAGVPSYVRFFFTYRSGENVHQTFNSLPDSDRLVISVDDEQGTKDDIHKFIEDQLDNTHAADLIDVVAEAAQTLFQCAAVLCRELTGPQLRSRPAFVQRLKDAPGMSLYESYRVILKMYMNENDDELMEQFRRVMAWVFLVQSPQPRRVFRAFAATFLTHKNDHNQPIMEDTILSWLGSLFSGTTSEGTPISPLHTSLRDFLLNPTESGKFHVDLNLHSQKELAWACLKIMNAGLYFNICQLPSFAWNSEVPDLHQQVKQYISAELCYASLATPHHLQRIVPLSATHNQQMSATPLAVKGTPIRSLFMGVTWSILLVSMKTSNLSSAPLLVAMLIYLYYNLGSYGMGWHVLRQRQIPSNRTATNIQVGLSVNVTDLELEAKLFLQQNFLYWLEVHNCMQTKLDDAPAVILPLFLEWARVSGADRLLEDILLDFIRFEKRFCEGIRLSVPQIYYSGLAFAPSNSVISRLYCPLFHHLIDVSAGGDILWPPLEPLVISEGSTSYISSVAFSPDGTRIASAGANTIMVWKVETGQQVGDALQGHEDIVRSITFSSDGMHIASGSRDNTIRVWNAATGQQVGDALCGHEGCISSVVFSPDGTCIVSGSWDKTIRMWDMATGQQIGEALRGHKHTVNSVVFSPDGTRIASGSIDRTVRIWDTATGQQIGEALSGHQSSVNSVVFFADGTRIASGSNDRTIRVWDAVTGHQTGNSEVWSGHTGGVDSVVVSPTDGTCIASGSKDGTIRMWDTATGHEVGKALRGHTSTVTSVMFSPDGACIASGSGDGTVRLWDMAGQQPIGKVERGLGHEYSVNSFFPDGAHMALGSNDRVFGECNTPVAVTENQVGKALDGHGDWVTSVTFSLDGTRIASGSWDNTIRVWDAATGQQVGKALNGHENSVNSVVFSPDGTRIASGSYDDTIRVWDTATGQQIGEALRGHESIVTSVVFSPDGTRIASGSYDSTVRIWDTATGQQFGGALNGHEDSVNSVAFSPDGTRIASGSHDKTIRVWDAATGHQVGEALSGHTRSVKSVAFSPDGTRIASGSRDKTIRMWDTATGQQVGELRGPKVNCVAFSPDGTCIASGCNDNTIRMWDIATGQQVGEALTGHIEEVISIAFSPDGSRVVSGSYDNAIRVWDVLALQGPCSTVLTDIRFHNTEFHLGPKSPILWIPHSFRDLNFVWSPGRCTMVMSAKGTVVLRFDEALWALDWTKIKK